MSIRPVKEIIQAQPTMEGAGVRLHRAFGFGKTEDFDPFLLFDDFSDSDSGWYSGEDNYVRAEYLEDEYRILGKRPGYIYLFSAPGCEREYYKVEVDVRWAPDRGDAYGLLMGIQPEFEEYYFFLVDSRHSSLHSLNARLVDGRLSQNLSITGPSLKALTKITWRPSTQMAS